MSKIQTTDSGSAWKHWRYIAAGALVTFVAAPVAVIAGFVTYVALGMKPRREVAWWTCAAGLALGLVLWRLGVPYRPALGQVAGAIWSGLPTGKTWSYLVPPIVALAGWQIVTGVTLGALVWRWLLTWRESDALQGPHRKDQRIDLEAETARRRLHRRQEWAHTPAGAWWTRPLTEPRRVVARRLGTVPEPRAPKWHDAVKSRMARANFILGRVLDGDMFRIGSWAWLAYTAHLVILGRTRHGKSETAQRQSQEALQQNWGVIMLNCKEPDNRETGPSARLAAYAERHGKTARILAPVEGFRYDPMRGSLDQLRARLLSIEEFTEPYYEAAATLLIDIALRIQAAAGEPITSVPGLIWSLASGGWRELANESRDPMIARLAEALGNREVEGAVVRYAAQAVRLRAYIEEGGWGFGDADVIGVDLPTSTENDAARALLRCMLTDIESWITDRSRRDMSKKVRLIVDEISALDSDPIIMRRVLNLMERAAGAGVYVTVIAQGPSALGDERTSEALLTNAAVISYQQSDKEAVERICLLAGTKYGIEASSQTTGWGRTGTGSARVQDQMNLPFNVLRRLKPGEHVLIDNGHWCRIGAGMTADSFGKTPAIAALAQRSEPDWTVRELPTQKTKRTAQRAQRVEQRADQPTAWAVDPQGQTERQHIHFEK